MRKKVNYFSVGGGRIDKCSYGNFFGHHYGFDVADSWSNFVWCSTFPHALRQFKRLKTKDRQIDLRCPKVGKARCVRHGKSWKL